MKAERESLKQAIVDLKRAIADDPWVKDLKDKEQCFICLQEGFADETWIRDKATFENGTREYVICPRCVIRLKEIAFK